MSKNLKPFTKALDGKRSDVWWTVAQALIDADYNIIKSSDFGEVGCELRKAATPKLSYLTKRGSQNLRIALGLSEVREGVVYGAVIRRSVGVYEWDSNMRWPAKGELWDRSDFRGLAPKKARTLSLPIGEANENTPPVEITPVEVPVADEVVAVPNENDAKVVALVGTVMVLQHDGKMFVLDVKSEVEM
jgi:hypothetical protein